MTTAVVARPQGDADLTGTGVSVQGQEGVSFTAPVASFHDPVSHGVSPTRCRSADHLVSPLVPASYLTRIQRLPVPRSMVARNSDTGSG